MPFPPGNDCPFSSLLSSRNRFYTHFNSQFVEFDPGQRAFTFVHATVAQMAMGMTGTLPNEFVSLNDTCSGMTLTPSATCTTAW